MTVTNPSNFKCLPSRVPTAFCLDQVFPLELQALQVRDAVRHQGRVEETQEWSQLTEAVARVLSLA